MPTTFQPEFAAERRKSGTRSWLLHYADFIRTWRRLDVQSGAARLRRDRGGGGESGSSSRTGHLGRRRKRRALPLRPCRSGRGALRRAAAPVGRCGRRPPGWRSRRPRVSWSPTRPRTCVCRQNGVRLSLHTRAVRLSSSEPAGRKWFIFVDTRFSPLVTKTHEHRLASWSVTAEPFL